MYTPWVELLLPAALAATR